MTAPNPAALAAISAELDPAMAEIAAVIPRANFEAWCVIVNYVAITHRVLAKTNPSRIVEAAKLVELQSYIPPAPATQEQLLDRILARSALFFEKDAT